MAMASAFPISPYNSPSVWAVRSVKETRVFISKSGGFAVSASKGCKTCRGQGAIECPGCKGSGKNKKNGNIFERWKALFNFDTVRIWKFLSPRVCDGCRCYDCQGFGMKSCPTCGKGGLTPEQRGER